MMLALHTTGKFTMSLFPNKDLFIVSSSLKPAIGIFNFEDRIEQTIETSKSIRKYAPNSYILLVDSSQHEFSQGEFLTLANHFNFIMNLYEDEQLKKLGSVGLKSQAETLLLLHAMIGLKRDPNLQQVMSGVRRVFKLSGRYQLDEGFDPKAYDDLFGKFVFRKRIPTWMPQIMHGASDLLVTRLFSMCPSLIDTYIHVLQQNFQLLSYMDTEHAHFVNIPKEYLVEFDKIHCKGQVASTGEWHYD